MPTQARHPAGQRRRTLLAALQPPALRPRAGAAPQRTSCCSKPSRCHCRRRWAGRLALCSLGRWSNTPLWFAWSFMNVLQVVHNRAHTRGTVCYMVTAGERRRCHISASSNHSTCHHVRRRSTTLAGSPRSDSSRAACDVSGTSRRVGPGHRSAAACCRRPSGHDGPDSCRSGGELCNDGLTCVCLRHHAHLRRSVVFAAPVSVQSGTEVTFACQAVISSGNGVALLQHAGMDEATAQLVAASMQQNTLIAGLSAAMQSTGQSGDDRACAPCCLCAASSTTQHRIAIPQDR